MSTGGGGNFYGVVGQPLTPDYLARQLPLFQQKVPKTTQNLVQFTTNAPPNLPSPPLYPGEVVQLQEHRVVCTDTFNEPAVGAIYITNYRIIFCGNVISDPESLDALQGASYPGKSKDTSILGGEPGSFSSKFKVNRNKSEANFHSFIYPEKVEAEKDKTRQSKRLKSGLRRTLGSLRRSPKRTKVDNKTATLPPPNHPPPLLDQTLLTRPASTDALDGSLGGESTKRKAIILNYDQDTASLDSASVSSLSEFSSTTGTDERSLHSPIGEMGGATTPIDIVEGAHFQLGQDVDTGFGPNIVPDSGFRGDSSLEATLCASSSELLDSGITFMDENRSILEDTMTKEPMPKPKPGKGSPYILVNNSAPNLENVVLRDGKRQNTFSKAHSIDTNVPGNAKAGIQRAATIDAPDGNFLASQRSNRRFWENSLVIVESDSDSEESSVRSTAFSDNLSLNSVSSPRSVDVQFVVGDKEREEEKEAVERTNGYKDRQEDIIGTGYSKIEVLGPRNESIGKENPTQITPPRVIANGLEASSEHSPEATVDHSLELSKKLQETRDLATPSTSTLNSLATDTTIEPTPTHPYANLHFGRGMSNPTSPLMTAKSNARVRSKSSSPKIAKKPKPLPRLYPGTLKQRGEGKEGLVSSLPADFKPTPPPKPSRLTLSKTEKPLSPPAEEDSPSSDNTQSSPEHQPPTTGNSKSEGDTLTEPARNEREVSPMPVPPPRLKRKSKHGKSISSTDSQSSPGTPRSPLTGPHALSTAVNGSHDQSQSDINKSHNQPGDVITKSHDQSTPNSKSSHDQESDVIDGSQDIFSEENINDTQDQFNSTRLNSDTSSRIESDQNSSRTSLSVLYSGNTSRPHSVVSASDFSNFNFTLEDRGGLAYNTMPRNMATTWSPKSQLQTRMNNRRSQKASMHASTRYTLSVACSLYSIHSVNKLHPVMLKDQGLKLPDGLLILSRTFHSLRLHIHPDNTYDADALRELLERTFLVAKPLYELFAFKYYSAIHLPNPTFIGNRSMSSFFKLSGEMSRLGLLGSKLWRVARLLVDRPDISPTYPPHLIMPICTPDLDIIRGASLYKEGRFPTLTWIHQNGAALLRSAATKEERGQGSSNQQMDEALLHAICGCNSSSKGPSTLFVFTEKGFSDNKHSSLKPDQVRSYYYHNCKFVYSENPPTFKSVRHSFNKLQALLENKIADEDYLLALDSTRWLQRVGELLSISLSVCHALCEERAHVLVCFESGWDRTTQVVSLAQLLADPFYRTMDGFQILIQKEWIWFGHPFRMRHSRQGKTRAKVDGPIFLQWVDCVWQVMHQCPTAFEFNERFLMSLVEEAYSGKFGTFMTDCEQVRKQTFTEKGYQHKCVSTHTVSYWTWVAMVNSVGRTFYNDLYDPQIYPSLIKPSSSVPCLSLWTAHYDKYRPQVTTNHTSVLQRRLEELVRTYKRLEAYRVNMQPLIQMTPHSESSAVPPPLMPRDEILERSQNGHHSPQAPRHKPTPPPKPAAVKQRFESIEQYLLREGLDPSLCKHVELGQSSCQGNLFKIGARRKNWLQRWFVLDFDCQYLAYFESKTAYGNREAPKGVIRLTDISKVYQNMKKRDHLIKNIVTIETGRRTYLIQAPSIITLDIWQTCLKMPADSFTVGVG